MEPHELGRALWRQKILVVVIFAVTTAAVALGVYLAPKSYTSTAVVSATSNPAGTGSAEDLDALRGTLGELANSMGVVDTVLEGLSVEREADSLRRSIAGEWVAGTVLIQITVQDSDPEVAAEIANAVATTLPLYEPSAETFLFTTSNDAQPAETYSSPNLLLAGGVGLVLASALSAVGALLRDRRRSTVDDASAAEEAINAPLLAHVSPPRDLTSLPAMYPGTAAADSFRHLRLSLEAEATNSPVQRIVVASVGGGEIHVWLGANLAISLAKVGRRVLLVDGRLGDRNGPAMSGGPDTAGLHEVLNGQDLDSALSAGPVEGLTVLPAGSASGETADVLVETNFAPLMARAEERFDVVIVLAPPLDVNDDARVMASGGSMLLALPEREISVASLRSHASRVRSVGADIVGVVLVGRGAERLPV